MRAYTAADEEVLRAQDLLKDWTGEALLTAEQRRQMESDLVCDLRRTNLFLRAVLFLFTALVVLAVVGLFFLGSRGQASGILLLTVGGAAYVSAEMAIMQARFYRYGIEEALLACSVGLLCGGISNLSPSGAGPIIPAVGTAASIWIWYRFGFAYATPVTMFFVAWLVQESTPSHPAQHVIAAALFAAGALTLATIRRPHRHTYLNARYSAAEGLFWLGVYLAINLMLSAFELFPRWWSIDPASNEFSGPFYWTTWVLTWCLPPAILARAVKIKDPFILAMGMITAILTLVTNKPYLGWERHTWDPMLLGAFLISTALFLRRWLAQGPGEVRHGLTARRLSGKDKAWMTVGTTALGFATPPQVPPPGTDAHFGGGASGGGGASSDF